MRAFGPALSLAGWLVCASAAWAADRTADQILKDIDAVKIAKLDPTKTDKASIREQQLHAKEASLKRARLIAELSKVAPDHKRVAALIEERWKTLSENPEKGRYAELLQELDRTIARTKNEKLKIEASYVRAKAKLHPVSTQKQPDASAALEFLKLAPKDSRAADLLGVAVLAAQDSKTKAALLERLAKDVPDSDLPGMLEETHDQKDAIGKRFHLEFTDAITGTTIAMRHLKGKVVVIDFWATWCGPCVGEMPKMKDLYSKYHDQGVEFIGVSLDRSESEGGLESLKNFVKENSIKWPQYYQGKYWNGDFSKSWGINSIPRVFVVAQDGKLFSVDARGKLDKMIPELLGKNKIASAAPTGGTGG